MPAVLGGLPSAGVITVKSAVAVKSVIAAGHPLSCPRIRLDPGEGHLAPTEDRPEPSPTAFRLVR